MAGWELCMLEPLRPGEQVEVFFDGDCPLCKREIAWLRRRDRQHRIRFTDLAAPDFDPAATGRTLEVLMARIHGRLPDGSWIEGVEVFRRLYSAIGFGPLVAVTRWPLVRQMLEMGYRLFARNRLRWTGRCENGTCSTSSSPLAPPASRNVPGSEPLA